MLLTGEIWISDHHSRDRKRLVIYQMVRDRVHRDSTSSDPFADKIGRIVREAIDEARRPVKYRKNPTKKYAAGRLGDGLLALPRSLADSPIW